MVIGALFGYASDQLAKVLPTKLPTRAAHAYPKHGVLCPVPIPASTRSQGRWIHFVVSRWAEKQPDMPTLSEATRRLVELGLTVKTKAKQPSAARSVRAKELAAKAIDKIIDPAAPPEERAQRRRRPIKGPSEFREDRVDLPKAKGKYGNRPVVVGQFDCG